MKSKIFFIKTIKLTYINKKRLARYNRKNYILKFPLSPRLEISLPYHKVEFKLHTFEFDRVKGLLEDYNGRIYFTIPTNARNEKLFGLGAKKFITTKYYKKTYSWFWNNYKPVECNIVFDNVTDRNLFRLSL